MTFLPGPRAFCGYYLGNNSSNSDGKGEPNNEVWHWVNVSGFAGCGAFGTCAGVDGIMLADQDWDEDESELKITHRAWFGIHPHPYYDCVDDPDCHVNQNLDCGTTQNWCLDTDEALLGFRNEVETSSDSDSWLPAWHLHTIQTTEDGTMLDWYSDYIGASVDSISNNGVTMFDRHPDASCNNYPLDNCPIGDGDRFDLEDFPELWGEYDWCIRGRSNSSADWQYGHVENIRFDFRNGKNEDHSGNEVAVARFEWDESSTLRANSGWEYEIGFRCANSSIGCPSTSQYF